MPLKPFSVPWTVNGWEDRGSESSVPPSCGVAAVGTSGQLAGAGGVGIFTGIWTKFSGHLDDSG